MLSLETETLASVVVQLNASLLLNSKESVSYNYLKLVRN